MNDENLQEEFSMMYEENSKPAKTLDASTFTMPIKSLRAHKPVTVAPTQTVAEAVKVMQEKHVGCVAVTEKEKLVGIFTERDVLMKIIGKKDPASITIQEVMTPKPESFQPDDNIAFILNAMHVGGYRHVPIVDEQGSPLSIASVKDIVSFILDHFAEDVLNLPPEPMRKTEQREGA
ncbi:MAG: CBS domain-containing protein [Ignavibacteriales bacterium]|nr:CBS domain-containing protein [Ignavibacteriales bacterium]